ncbi:hypothetical protein [Glutamicibacter ardleyensis]|uniref:hypothetical protein n=1 Tax=Glutamicibacter ardleyensis TaxID=225894 RepID=UPI003FD191AE
MTRRLSKRLFMGSIMLLIVAPLVTGAIALANDQPLAEWVAGSLLPVVAVAAATALVAWYVYANADDVDPH